MNLYRIGGQAPDLNTRVIWVGSQADAAKARKELTTSGFKRDQIKTDEVDVPTNKEGLLAFLNKLENRE